MDTSNVATQIVEKSAGYGLDDAEVGYGVVSARAGSAKHEQDAHDRYTAHTVRR